jgi:multiple sugar transport system substrate-binding protein
MWRTARAGLIVVALSATFLAGCDQKSPPETIRILGEDSSNLQAIERVKAQFESANNVRIEIERVPFADALEKANQDLALGTGRYDIVLQYNFTLSSYVEGGYVWSLDQLKADHPSIDTSFESSLFPNAWREVGFYYGGADHNGPPQPFGYPFAANTMLLVYNRQMFEDAGNQARFQAAYHRPLAVPKTWDEFKQIADFFTDPSHGTHGVVLQGGADGWLYYEYAAILNSMGGAVLPKIYGWERKADAEVDLTDDTPMRAASLYLSLKPDNAGDFKKYGAVEQRQLFRQGNIALAIMWSDYVYDLTFSDGVRSKQFGFAPLPGNSSPLAGGSFYINKRSRHVATAFAFLSWLLDPKRQSGLVKQGLASPLRTAYTPEVIEAVPYADALRRSIDRGSYAFEANRDSELIQTEITVALQQAWDDPGGLRDDLLSASRNINRKRTPLFLK